MTDASALQATIASAQAGTATTGEVLAAFLGSQVLVPTVDEYQVDKPLNPLFLTIEGAQFMLVFTSFDRLKPFEGSTKSAAALEGKDVVLGIQSSEVGIIIDPGTPTGFQIDGPAVAKLAQYVASKLG